MDTEGLKTVRREGGQMSRKGRWNKLKARVSGSDGYNGKGEMW